MKICWDNLEKLRYNSKTGKWYKKKQPYFYKEFCKICHVPFLTYSLNGIYCSNSCHNKDRDFTNEIKNNISNSRKGKLTGENNPCWRGGYNSNNLPRYNTYAYRISYAEQVRRSIIDQNVLEVKCAYCGRWYIPKLIDIQNRIQVLEGKQRGEQRFYCSTSCKKECPIYNQKLYPKGYKKASSREVQPQLRQMVFERDDWTCQKCGSKESLHCHHVEGVRWEPLESADIDKCITYCKNCHEEVHLIEGCRYYEMRCEEELSQ